MLEETARRAFVATLVVVSTAGALWGAWYAREVLFLVFAAWLLSLVLSFLAELVERHTRLSRTVALAAVLVLVVLPLLALTAGLAGQIMGEVSALARRLPSALQKAQERLSQMVGWPIRIQLQGQLMQRATGVFSSGLGAVGALLFVFFLGLFLAAEPGVYRRGLLALVPAGQRPRAGDIADRVGARVQRWLLARLLLMAAVALMTGLALTLLGVPTALGLGALAGLLDFVPNVGPILAAVPAVLLVLDEGTSRVLTVIGVYVAIQSVEGYLLGPLVERRAVRMAPGLILMAQALLGYVVGWLGLMFATPLTAAALVIFNDVRGEEEAAEDGG